MVKEEMQKIRFVIVGSGWRALYYVRIAKALPDMFELCAMYCRKEEKAKKLAEEYQIHTTTSIEECEKYAPDFVVVVVNKTSIAEVSIEWMKRGFPVICETPAGLDIQTLNGLWKMQQLGYKLIVAEQYTRYPEYRGIFEIIKQKKIGEPDCLNISLAHEYHAASLMRTFLQIPVEESFCVSAKTYEFPTVETLTRYESYKDGRVANKKRTVATFEFRSGKTVFYDFDSEQYRSPIRKNTVKLQGRRGEIIDNKVYYLDEKNEACAEEIKIETRISERTYNNPNLKRVEEIVTISFEDKVIYTSEFGICGLSSDEVAIASLMIDCAAYVRGGVKEPYALKEALQDAYMAILMKEAVESGDTIYSARQAWQ